MRAVHLSRCGLVILLFLAIWNVGLAQDSLGMSRVATLAYWQGIWDMEITGNTGYFAGCLSGLHIMDLSNPVEPIEVTYRDGVALNVCISNNRAYTTSGLGGVVLDISNPTQPQELGRWHIGGTYHMFEDILVRGDIGVVTTEEGCPFVLDVSDPENVHVIGNDPFAECYMRPVGMVGDYFGLMGNQGTFGGGLRLYDLSNPEQPVQVASIDTTYATFDAVIYGGYAYLATSSHGLRIVDLSNPLQPVVVATCDDSVNSPCYSVTVTGDYAVVAKEWGLNIWNVANHSDPIFEGSLTTNTQTWRLFSTGAFVYVPTYYPSTTLATVVDISNPADPVEVNSFGHLGGIGRMVVSGTTTYVAGGWAGLTIIDTSNPDSLFEVEISEPSGLSNSYADIAKKDDYVYMPNRYQSLFVVDIHDLTQPQFSLGWQAGFQAYLSRIIIVGDYAYVGDEWHQRLHIFNLTDPSSPVWIDSLNMPGWWGTFGLATYENYLCVVDWDGFYTLSLVNPAVPQLVGLLNQEMGLELAIVGHYAFVAANSVVHIIDISDPSQPTLVGQLSAECRAIAARANTLVTADDNGLKAWDVTNPLNPQLAGYYTTYAEIENIEEIEDVEILDGYVLTTSPYRFRAYECDALLDAKERRVTMPQAFALHPCYPNPFNASTVLNYSLPVTGQIRLTIHNIMGQRLVTLYEGMQLAGTYTATWDASQIGSGLYFAQLQSGNYTKTIKMVLLK